MSVLRRVLGGPVLLFIGLTLMLALPVFALHLGLGVFATPTPEGSFDPYPSGWSAPSGRGPVLASVRPVLAAEPGGAGVFAFLPDGITLGRWQFTAATGALAGPQPTALRTLGGRAVELRVLPAAGGGYHVAWCETSTAGQQLVYARMDADLRLVAGPLRVQAPAPEAEVPAMAPLPGGDLLLVWSNYATPGGFRLWRGRVQGGELREVEMLPERGRLPQALADAGGVDVAYLRTGALPSVAYLRLDAAGRVVAGPEGLDVGSEQVRSLQLLRAPAGVLALLVGQKGPSGGSGPEGAELLLRPAGGAWGQRREVMRAQPLYDLTGIVQDNRLHLLWTDLRTNTFAIFYRSAGLAAEERPGMPVLLSAGAGEGGNHLPALAAVDGGILTVWTENRPGPGALRLRETLHPAPPPTAARLGLDPARPVSQALFNVMGAAAQAMLAAMGGLPLVVGLGLLLALLARRLPERRRDWLLLALGSLGAWVFTWVTSPLQLAVPLWPAALPWPLWARLLAPLGATAAVAVFMRVRRWQPGSEVLAIFPLLAFWLYFHRLVLALPLVAGFR